MLLSADALWVLLGAIVVDAAIGDPDRLWRRWPHPVVWLGRLVALADQELNRESWSEPARRASGALALTMILGIALAAGWAAERGLRALPAGPLWVALAASVLLAGRSLHDHVRRVRLAFPSGGLEAARVAVSMIVGRDPASLDEAGVVRASVESAAENLSDGLVAPACWFALLGLPGLVAYKAVNTADSMIGHLSARHRAFGWASARFDDLVNLAPARLCGVLVALAAPAVGGSIGTAVRIMLRDSGIHRSPNAGWPESAMAGALGIALAGPRRYAAGPVDEPFLHPEGRQPAVPDDIDRALQVLVTAGMLHAALWLVLALALALALD